MTEHRTQEKDHRKRPTIQNLERKLNYKKSTNEKDENGQKVAQTFLRRINRFRSPFAVRPCKAFIYSLYKTVGGRKQITIKN